MARIARWALVVGVMGLVGWIRTLPLDVPETDIRADRFLRHQVRNALAEQIMRQFPPPQWEAQADAQVAQWIERNRAEFEAKRKTVSAEFKALLQHPGPDGREYVYLGDLDSYAWLRAARTYLRSGTTCDAIVDGDCRDTFTLAPVGTHMKYGRSLHIAAIVGLHRLITAVHPGHPLSATAYWVPVLVGMGLASPAFAIGRRLGGDLGGLWAAVLIALHPMLLIRSIGSDNDVWNAALPLCMTAAALAAVAARERWRQLVYAAVAAACAGMHAATWRGWIFFFLVVLAGLAGGALMAAVPALAAPHAAPAKRHGGMRRIALVAAVLAVGGAVLSMLIGVEGAEISQLFDLAGKLVGPGPRTAAPADAWPNVFSTVAELVPPDAPQIIRSAGGAMVFGTAALGLVLLALPGRRWRLRHLAVLGGAAGGLALLLAGLHVGRTAVLVLLGLPVIAALLARVFDREPGAAAADCATAVVALWFFAALYLAFRGRRFELLLGPPVGLAAGACAGRLHRWATATMGAVAGRRRRLAEIALFLALAAVLVPPLRRAHATASAYLPAMNDAWWDTLVKIRDESPPDAIVNTWWDYGYWVKYVAERRVTVDGGSLNAHLTTWLARAMVTPDARESRAILRMLNCGSEAYFTPQGHHGAYGKVLTRTGDPVAAYEIVDVLLRLDASSARAYLADRGFAPAEQEDVLRATHCEPPPSYLVISGEQLLGPDQWLRQGLWDLRRRYALHEAGRHPAAEAIATLATRLGYTTERAAALYDEARSGGPEEVLYASEPLLPPHRRSTEWLACQPAAAGGILECHIGLTLERAGAVLEAFVFDPAAPENSKLRYRRLGNGDLPERVADGTPALLVVAAAQRSEVPFVAPTFPGIGVLADLRHQRILVGIPPLIRSTFMNLLYLDGRYTPEFRKFDDRSVGYRVVTWRIDWNG